jgi:SAM-dependent methyltransferase
MSGSQEQIYTMGRSEAETRRLITQARLYDGATAHMLSAAGLEAGMKVLDVGTGAGDVAMIAARVVGPGGLVIAIDKNPAILATARSRAKAEGLDNVTFVEGDMLTARLDSDFDVAVGRLVLLYAPDPVESIRIVASHTGKGGAVAFEELELTSLSDNAQANPDHKQYAVLASWVLSTFSKSGAHLSVGNGLYRSFIAAGLGEPTLFRYAPSGGPPDWIGFAYYAVELPRFGRQVRACGRGNAPVLLFIPNRAFIVQG